MSKSKPKDTHALLDVLTWSPSEWCRHPCLARIRGFPPWFPDWSYGRPNSNLDAHPDACQIQREIMKDVVLKTVDNYIHPSIHTARCPWPNPGGSFPRESPFHVDPWWSWIALGLSESSGFVESILTPTLSLFLSQTNDKTRLTTTENVPDTNLFGHGQSIYWTTRTPMLVQMKLKHKYIHRMWTNGWLDSWSWPVEQACTHTW